MLMPLVKSLPLLSCFTLLATGSNHLCVRETKIKKGIHNVSLWSESISERQTPPQIFTNTKLFTPHSFGC